GLLPIAALTGPPDCEAQYLEVQPYPERQPDDPDLQYEIEEDVVRVRGGVHVDVAQCRAVLQAVGARWDASAQTDADPWPPGREIEIGRPDRGTRVAHHHLERDASVVRLRTGKPQARDHLQACRRDDESEDNDGGHLLQVQPPAQDPQYDQESGEGHEQRRD